MTNQPKLSWEVEKTSLVLRVSDGAKETTWKLRKSMYSPQLITIFNEIVNSLWQAGPAPWDGEPMIENVRTVDAEELAAIRGISVDAVTEEASRAALKAKADAVSNQAKWWDREEDDVAFLPDYDSGEIK